MFETLVRSERTNAAIGWLLVGILALAVVVSLARGAWLWACFAVVSVVTTLLPIALTRDVQAMVPWPVLALLTGAVAVRAVDVAPRTAGYLAIASLALVFVVELVTFTPVQLSHRLAVLFAVMTTLALEALWIIVQYYADLWLDTDFLRSQTAVQQDIVLVTVVGAIIGVVYEAFFHWFEPAGTLDRSARHTEDA